MGDLRRLGLSVGQDFSIQTGSAALGTVQRHDAAGPAIGDFGRWRDNLHTLSSRVQSLSAGMDSLGNELFGTEPEPVAKPPGDENLRCQVDAMDREIERLINAVGMAETRFRRLLRLVSG